MHFSSISIESNSATTSQYLHNLRRQVKQNMRPEKVPASDNIDTELQSSPKPNCGNPFPLLAIDTPPQSPVEQISLVEALSTNKPIMKATVKQRLHDLKRHAKQMRSQQAPESKCIESSHRLNVKATVRQYLHNLKHHVKQICPQQNPESGNTVELQPSSSSSGCKLKQVPTLFPMVVQCPEKVPESGHITFVEPSCSKPSPEQDGHISFDEPQPRPNKSTCGLRRVPTPYPLAPVDTPPPQSPVVPYISLVELESSPKSNCDILFPRPGIDTPPESPKLNAKRTKVVSFAELPCPEKPSELKRVPTPFPRKTIDTPQNDKRTTTISFAELPCPEKPSELKRVPTPFPRKIIDTPQSPKLNDKRTTTISFAELSRPDKSCELKRVPTPFPRPAIDTPPQTPKYIDNCTLGPRRWEIEQVPTLYSLPPAFDTFPQSPVEDNDKYTKDTRRHAWYGPPDFFPNARRHKVTVPTETRQYVRPMDFLRGGHSVVGVG